MTPGQRKQMLSALGLVDWQPRPDGPLAAGAASVAQPSDVADEESAVAAARAQSDSAVAEAAEPSVATTPALEPAIEEPVTAEQAEPNSPPEEPAESAAPPPDLSAPVEPAELHTPEAEEESFGPVSSMDWDTLEAWLATRDHRGATRPVFGIGARDADVLIVGEAPGASEDAQGVPFVGRAGKLLDRMLCAIGCSRDSNVYITNICKFRPPNNRDPNSDEVAADWPILERQIELMDPKLVVAVGRVAAQTLLDSKASLGKLRGELHRYPHRELDVLVTYHPAFLLRSPGQKAKAWDDLKRIARRIAQP